MQLLVDKNLYTDFVILHRMRVVHVYRVWEKLGDFLRERGFPIHAFMMYVGGSLMRSETRQKDRENGIIFQKANELGLQINASDNKQMGVYAFREIMKNWTLGNLTKLSLFLQALLHKALATYFLRQNLCFVTAMDFEIRYLNQIFELGFFNNNLEWLICNLLNIALNAMDINNSTRRLKQAKHLLHIVRVLMSRCNRDQGRYQFLYELYQLCKCAYWAIKLETNGNDISNRFVFFNLPSLGVNVIDSSQCDVNLIQSVEDIVDTFKKIRGASLMDAVNKDITKIYIEILRNCQEKYNFL